MDANDATQTKNDCELSSGFCAALFVRWLPLAALSCGKRKQGDVSSHMSQKSKEEKK